MTQDAEFYEGFDKYGPTGKSVTVTDLGGEWTNTVAPGLATLALTIDDPLIATGNSLLITKSSGATSTLGHLCLRKTVAGNYARTIGGRSFVAYFPVEDTRPVFELCDGASVQLTIGIDAAGRIAVLRGTYSAGTLLATSTQSVSSGAAHYIQWDATIHNSAGAVKVWLDGVATSIDLTGVNTRATSNNYLNVVGAGAAIVGLTSDAGDILKVDHWNDWFFTASGGGETPPLTNPIIETQSPMEDAAVDFAFGAGVLGEAFRITTTTNAPGANRVSLRQVTPDFDTAYSPAPTIASVSIVPAATSASAKFKAVVYADNGSNAPGALLDEGTEVIGCTSGAQLDLPLTTPVAITEDTPYWIGYLTDTSIAIRLYDTLLRGVGAARTYASGAANPAGAMTSGLATWQIWANLAGVQVNYAEVDQNPPVGDLSYVTSDTVGHQDLFEFDPLASTPTVIYGIAVKANMRRTDGGARTMNLIHKSGAVQGDGLNPGQTPATTYGWVSSYYRVDPDTGAAFNTSGLNAGQSGYEIAS